MTLAYSPIAHKTRLKTQSPVITPAQRPARMRLGVGDDDGKGIVSTTSISSDDESSAQTRSKDSC
jgi:hypothetical protein